jgi:tetratricopeptide (TPR) repeat protein
VATKDQLIASAQKNLEKGQIKKAIKDYQELLKLEPKVDQHKQKLADLLCRVDLKEEALSLYDSLAKGYAERGFFAKGVAVYKQMQRIDPTRPEVYLRLAELNRSLGLIGNAMSEYRSLLDLYEKRNMVADAAGVLQKMVELEPENINLQLRVLQNFLKEKLYGKATDTILKACEVCAKSGDSAKSQKILQSILSHLPDKNEFHIELAGKLSAGGLFTDAIYLFQALLTNAPQDPLILGELATLYDKIGVAKNELEPVLPAMVEEPPSPPEEVSLAEPAEDLSFGAEEFGLDDLLSPGPRSSNAAPLSRPEEEVVAEELADVLIDLPLEGVSFDDLDTFAEELVDAAMEIADEEISVEDLDTMEEITAPTFAEDVRQDEVAPPLINIDFDFSEFDDVEVETEPEVADGVEIESAVEIEIEAGVEIEADFDDVIELDLPDEEDIEQIDTIPTYDLVDRSAGVPGLDLSPPEELLTSVESFQGHAALPPSEIDYDFAELTAVEATAEDEVENDDDVMAVDVEILDEDVEDDDDDDEILELEPLEEEETDLDAELAALEELLAAGMEETPPEQGFDLNVAVDQVASAVPLDDDDDFFDLAAEILDDGALQATEGLANVGEIDRFRFDSVFSEFKKGVDAQIDHEDTEAHYDLGIAYKEMGLMDDAIEEFKKSMRSLKRLADSLILIGICYAEKGAFADAEAVFSTAIARPEVQEADKVGTQYELGLVYEVWGRPVDALRTFEAVADSDPSFRNVGEKIEALRLLVSAGSSELVDNTPGAASPGKDRISFV